MEKIKYRNMVVQILLLIITFGFYYIYWFYQTSRELQIKTGDPDVRPVIWTVLLFIPLGNLFAWYMYCDIYAKVGTERINKWILWILSWLFIPALWFLIQRDLNTWSREYNETIAS